MARIANKFLAQMVERGYAITPWTEVRLNDREPAVFRPVFRKSIETGKVLLDRRPAYLRATA